MCSQTGWAGGRGIEDGGGYGRRGEKQKEAEGVGGGRNKDDEAETEDTGDTGNGAKRSRRAAAPVTLRTYFQEKGEALEQMQERREKNYEKIMTSFVERLQQGRARCPGSACSTSDLDERKIAIEEGRQKIAELEQLLEAAKEAHRDGHGPKEDVLATYAALFGGGSERKCQWHGRWGMRVYLVLCLALRWGATTVVWGISPVFPLVMRAAFR